MSALPALLELIDDLDRDWYSPYYDFGFGIRPERIHRHRRPLSILGYTAPLRLMNPDQLISRRSADSKNSSSIGKDGFQVCMDVAQFKPNELNVKVVDNTIVVEGKHEEREDDHGYISRHFVRRYALPKDYEADKVMSTLSSDGVLTVSVPKPPAIEDKSKERVIQIQQTGPAHLNVKENAVDAGAAGDAGVAEGEQAKK